MSLQLRGQTKNLYVIVGMTCSGKTTLANRLKKSECFGAKHLHVAKTLTTRPARENKASDSSVKHITEPAYLEKYDEIVCKATYAGNHYGVELDELKKSSFVILTPDAIPELIEAVAPRNVYCIYIKSEGPHIDRLLARGDTKEAIQRRVENDKNLFTEFETWLKEHPEFEVRTHTMTDVMSFVQLFCVQKFIKWAEWETEKSRWKA